MLTSTQLTNIHDTIINDPRFQAKMNQVMSFSGKEKGHSNASPVEDTIAEILVNKLNAIKSKKTRSLDDITIDSHLFNIKFGDEEMGNPNMCSMNRIVKSFIKDFL